MHQRAVGRERQLPATRDNDLAPIRAAPTPGRSTLTQALPAQSEPCAYTQAVESATRELRAVGNMSLPALISALREAPP